MKTFIPIVDQWRIYDNSLGETEVIGQGILKENREIYNAAKWDRLQIISNSIK